MDDVDATHDAENAPVTPPEASAEESPSPVTEAENGAGDGDDQARGDDPRLRSAEAMRYRTRLRAAEKQVGERDGVIGALRGEVDRMHRAEVERIASDLANPPDLWLVADLADLRDDDGRLDEGKVRDKVAEVMRDRPGWRARTPSFDGGARITPEIPRRPGLSDLLKPT